MHQIRYALFYDFHTSPLHPGIGKDFDAEKLTDRFLECGVDYVTFHARCNMGVAYYDTAIGTRHPNLPFDLFGQLAEACHRKGIAVGAYFNAGISRYEGVNHRDWTKIYPDGTSYHEPKTGPFSMTMCYSSGYHDHLIAMAEEVARKYPVSGFFFDCLGNWPCICPNCARKMKEIGMDPRDPDEVKKYGVIAQKRMVDDLGKAVKAIDPEYLIYFNDVPFEMQAEAGSYLEFECLPAKSGGYKYMHTAPHYMRTLGKQCVHMTGRFNQWSDFGGLRNAKSLKYDLFFALSNGLRPNIGDHLNPSGAVNEAVFDRCREVFSALQRYDRWFDSARTEADAAIVWNDGRTVRCSPIIDGAIRLLSEAKIQFDIVTTASSWEKYDLLVFPDEVPFDDETEKRVERHLAKGGKIIASGRSGLRKNGSFPEAWGVDFIGNAPFTPAYFQGMKNVTEDMPFSFYEEAVEVRPHAETAVLSNLVRPALVREWDGLYPEYYNPPWEKTGLPFLTIRGNVAYFSGNIFLGYGKKAPEQVRKMVVHVMDKLGFSPMLQLVDAPSFVQPYVNRTDHGLTIPMLAAIPEKRGSEMESVEDELTAGGFELKIRTGKDPEKVFMAPDGAALKWKRCGEYVSVTVPQFTGFGMLVLE